MQKENISIILPNFAFLVVRNCQNNKIITKIDIFMTLKNPYVHLVPQWNWNAIFFNSLWGVYIPLLVINDSSSSETWAIFLTNRNFQQKSISSKRVIYFQFPSFWLLTASISWDLTPLRVWQKILHSDLLHESSSLTFKQAKMA